MLIGYFYWSCGELCTFGRPFVKRFALCYIGPLSVLSVTLVYCGQMVGRIKMKLGVQVGLGPGHVVLDGDPAPLPPKGHSPPNFGSYLLRPNGCMDQDVTWYETRPRPRRLCVRWRSRFPSPKGDGAPQIFGPCLLRPNGLMNEAGTWHGGRLQPRRLCVRWGPSPLPPKRGGASLPVFGCGQTARCIKMPLGIDVGLSPGDFVLDGDPVFPTQQRGRSPLPIFGPFLLCPNGWVHQDATRYGLEVGLSPGLFVLDGDPAPLPKSTR